MGTVYCGPFADALGDHEGYAARVLPDGTETGSWTYETREFTGHRAHCECGWRGSAIYPATDRGGELADEEWNRVHLRPLVDAVAGRHSVSALRLLAWSREMRTALASTSDARGMERLTDRSRGVLDALEQVEELLDASARNEDTGVGRGWPVNRS